MVLCRSAFGGERSKRRISRRRFLPPRFSAPARFAAQRAKTFVSRFYHVCCYYYFSERSQQPNGPNASRLVESLLGTRFDCVHVEQFAVAASVLPPARSAHPIQQVSQRYTYVLRIVHLFLFFKTHSKNGLRPANLFECAPFVCVSFSHCRTYPIFILFFCSLLKWLI